MDALVRQGRGEEGAVMKFSPFIHAKNKVGDDLILLRSSLTTGFFFSFLFLSGYDVSFQSWRATAVQSLAFYLI